MIRSRTFLVSLLLGAFSCSDPSQEGPGLSSADADAGTNDDPGDSNEGNDDEGAEPGFDGGTLPQDTNSTEPSNTEDDVEPSDNPFEPEDDTGNGGRAGEPDNGNGGSTSGENDSGGGAAEGGSGGCTTNDCGQPGSGGENAQNGGTGGNTDPGAGGDGSSGEPECAGHLDCQFEEHCEDGVCLPDQCQAGASYCDGLNVVECDMWGQRESVWGTCNDSRCLQFGNFASCESNSCAPSAEFCNPGENLVRRCNDDARTTAIVEDCAANGEVCVGSSCDPVVCEPGTRDCSTTTNSVLECSAEGDRMASQGGCTSGRHCDAEVGACALNVCVPNQRLCDGPVATRCNALGSAIEPGGVDCRDTDEVCSQGECKPVICEAGTVFCRENAIRTCNYDGTNETLDESCDSTEYCDPETLACIMRDCFPDDSWCEENLSFTCDALGAGPLDSGTDCGLTGQYCFEGTCQDLACFPEADYCDEELVRRCNDNGTSSEVIASCDGTRYCEGGRCYDEVCRPDLPVCDGERAAMCNANGSVFLDGGETCASPQYCSDGLCTDAMFWEGFEDNDLPDWYGLLSNEVHTVGFWPSGANDSGTSIDIGRSAAYGEGGGLYRLFDTVTPASVRWWVNAQTFYDCAYFELRSELDETLVTVHFLQSGYVGLNGEDTERFYGTGTWYPLQLDIDWGARTLDFTFNSQLVASDVPLLGEGEGIARLDLYSADTGGRARYDDIEFR